MTEDGRDDSGAHRRNRGDSFGALYLHVPFCASRCAYCDFATEAVDREDERCIAAMDAYVDQLVVALRRASRAGLLGSVRTVYIGGGTPTVLGHARLVKLVYALSVSVNLDEGVEFTIEANPESFSEKLVNDLYALGVNRVSFGVQSFDENVLRTLGRLHDVHDAYRAIEEARERFDNVSADLMCGVPGQSAASWDATLDSFVSLDIPHVSIYPLMVEEGTPLALRIARGRLEAPDDDVEASMMLRASEVLGAAGLARYEVASYAKPGYASRHNHAYWHGVPYLGLGRGASSMFPASMLDRILEARVLPGLDEASARYTEETGGAHDGFLHGARIRFAVGLDAAPDIEMLTAPEALAEDLMLAMRCTEGIGKEQVIDAEKRLPALAPTIERLESEGLVAWRTAGDSSLHSAGMSPASDMSLVPTARGWLLGNEVFGALWDTRRSAPAGRA